ncbi:MAG TPA: glycosyltransferase family 1 protein [Pyrinomonadaceae bacterium]|nr:glycosyltransferase family 1 protein [Pyrinomonadaceae bacterium]
MSDKGKFSNKALAGGAGLIRKVSGGHNGNGEGGDSSRAQLCNERKASTQYSWIDDAFAATRADLVCLSHLRWNFVYQRPQHLMSRFARERRVFFVEEPIVDEGPMRLDISRSEEGVFVVVPRMPAGVLSDAASEAVMQGLLDRLFAEQNIVSPVLWYYTPMALGFSRHVKASAVVYDCMDELSAFRGAPRQLRDREAELFRRADLVFTGGQSLYEAKRGQHPSVHAFPSSIEREHFAQARSLDTDPEDQHAIPHPRVGFFGVIDERFDTELLDGAARLRPDWHFVILGPVVKIDEKDLPRRPNIHYLGMKSYQELPGYLAGWDVAALFFARNESTRYISPTKTPEYLAAGKPVVSTSIRDVVRPYGDLGLVRIADTPDEFVAAAERCMSEDSRSEEWRTRVDEFLAKTSWRRTWARMTELIELVSARRAQPRAAERRPSVSPQPATRAASAGSYAAGD